MKKMLFAVLTAIMMVMVPANAGWFSNDLVLYCKIKSTMNMDNGTVLEQFSKEKFDKQEVHKIILHKDKGTLDTYIGGGRTARLVQQDGDAYEFDNGDAVVKYEGVWMYWVALKQLGGIFTRGNLYVIHMCAEDPDSIKYAVK